VYTEKQCREIIEHAESGKKLLPAEDIAVPTAFSCADCCRRLERFDVAVRFIEALDEYPAVKTESVRQAIAVHLEAIAARSVEPKLDDGTPDFEQPSSEPIEGPPPLLIRGWNFGWAMARWALEGFPMRSSAEIDRRLAICQACDFLRNNECLKCGCPTEGLISKLSVATEQCPEGFWD